MRMMVSIYTYLYAINWYQSCLVAIIFYVICRL